MNYERIPSTLFEKFEKYFPFASVDVVVYDGDSFILTKRAIQPYKNKWHLVGGVVHKNQRLESRAKQVVKEELNLDVKIEKFLGTYEDLGLQRHYISHAFVAQIIRGRIKIDFQSEDAKFFKSIPNNIIPFHVKIIRDAKLFFKNK